MDVMLSPEFAAGLLVSLAALSGGALGTWSAVKNAQGPRERNFVISGYMIMWAVTVILMTFIFLLGRPWNLLMLVILVVTIPALIYRITLRSLLIRQFEHRTARRTRTRNRASPLSSEKPEGDAV
jgi:small-conductance mechanosensitive channel